MQEKIQLKDVPWMSILKSKQIYILCAVFFKLACSVENIPVVLLGMPHDEIYDQLSLLLPFTCAVAIILIGTSITMDFLVKRFKTNDLKIRKIFICGGFLLQCILLVAAISATSEYAKGVFFILSFSVFSLSVPGCLTYPLYISRRYVALIGGIAFSFYCLGIVSLYVIQIKFEGFGDTWIYLLDGTISLSTAIAFGIWGEVEEQQWSLISFSCHRSHDYMRNPNPDEDNVPNPEEVHV